MTSIKFVVKSAQHRSTNLHLHHCSTQHPSKIFFLPSHIVYMLCFVLFGHVPSLFESHRCAHAQAATAIPTAIFARWPFANRALHGAHSPMSTTHNFCLSLTAHYPFSWPTPLAKQFRVMGDDCCSAPDTEPDCIA